MKPLSANLFAVLLLCALTSVVYVWSALESRLKQHKRRSASVVLGAPGGGGGTPLDLSAKTFRALLAVPQKPPNRTKVEDKRGGGGRGAPLLRSDSILQDGIFWSDRIEERLKAVGFGDSGAWQRKARASKVVKLEAGCGRISNRLATFADGTRACVRYGINADQVQGETLTFYLASLLGIKNLPPLVLSRVDGEQWSSVRLGGLQWSDAAVVSLTKWIGNLTGVVTPLPFRHNSSGLSPAEELLRHRTLEELAELAQWTDLILFDYLTANFDRLVSNLFSLQWDPRVMERDTNNLLRTPSGDLVFVDNEAGLVHGFRVLAMWEKYHSGVLSSVCVFRRRTAQRLAELHRNRDAARRLMEAYRRDEPLATDLGFLSDEHAAVLQERIDRVHRHISHCRGRFGGITVTG